MIATRVLLRNACARFVFVACLLLSDVGFAQSPWIVTVTPTLNPLAVGYCGAVQLTILDPSNKEAPRNPQGYRVTMADFDMTVTGNSVAGHQIDATHFEVCGCQGGSPGSMGTVTATYPAQNLATAARVPGVAFQKSAPFILEVAKGPVNPPSCLTAASVASPTYTPMPPNSTAARRVPTPGSAPPPVAALPADTTPVGRVADPAPVPAAAPPTAPPVAALPVDTTPVGRVAIPAPVPTGAPPIVPAALPDTGNPVAGAIPAPATGRVPAAQVPPAASTPAMLNPSGFTAMQTGPGQVQLSWQPVNGVSSYGLFGPGVTTGGARLSATTTSFTATDVPAGNQEWALGAFYDANNSSTSALEFPRVTLNVTAVAATPPPAPAAPVASATPPATAAPATSGKYLVTVTRLRAYQASVDDILSRDGVGDEVYAAAYVRRYDRSTGQLLDAVVRQTATYGDVNNFTQRLQAGSRSGTGGIKDGDPIPDGPLIATRSVPAQDVTYPWRLWEGTLTDGSDAIIITPSLWEQDSTPDLYALWVQQQQALNLSIFTSQSVQEQITQKIFGALVSGAAGIGGGTGLGGQLRVAVDFALVNLLMPVASLLSSSNDRPIGLSANGFDGAMLPNHAIVLTREIIEAALARPALGIIPSPVLGHPIPTVRIGMAAPVPGLMMIQFEDRDMPGTFGINERPAIYQMFIQVERRP